MEDLIVLGTGNDVATKCFNTCSIIKNESGCFLIDTGGGNGILSALNKALIPLSDIHHVFISHGHTDHMLGILWLVRMIGASMHRNTYDGELHIYCHEELVKVIRTIAPLTVQKKFCRFFDSRMIFHPLCDHDQRFILDQQVTFFDIGSTKTEQFGFMIQLNSGPRLTFLGDEPYKEKSKFFLEQSDWLLSEAFCLYQERHLFHPYEKHHSTVREACEVAESFHIPNLVLWHTEDTHLKSRKKLYKQEGSVYYSGRLFIPDDLEIIHLNELL